MDARLQRRVQRYGWDKASAYYEEYWSQQLQPAQDELMAMADLQAGERVLDVACGTGLVTFPAAESVGPSGEVVATDLSQSMVDSAQAEAADRGITQTRFLRMDAEDLDLETESFDVALCALGLMYVPDPPRSARELHRVLRPGGRTVVAVWGERRKCGWADIFPIVDSRVNSEVCPMFFQLGAQDLMEQTLREAGFIEVVTHRLSTTLHYDSADDAIGAAFAGGPVALAYSRFDEQTRTAAHNEYLSSIEEYREGSGYQIPGEFVVVRGEKP